MEQYIHNTRGRTFQAINPTLGTGIASKVNTAYDATKGALTLRNKGTRHALVPVSLYVRCKAAGTNDTDLSAAFDLDPTGATKRRSAGGSPITPSWRFVSGDGRDVKVTNAIDAEVYFGDLTLNNLQSGAERLYDKKLKATQTAVGDEYRFDFLERSPEAMSRYVGPAVLFPSDELALYLFGTAMSAAPTWEFLLLAKQMPLLT